VVWYLVKRWKNFTFTLSDPRPVESVDSDAFILFTDVYQVWLLIFPILHIKSEIRIS